MTYFLGLSAGEWVVNIWSRIFAEKNPIIFKVCIRTDSGGRAVSQMWTGVDRGEGVTNH